MWRSISAKCAFYALPLGVQAVMQAPHRLISRYQYAPSQGRHCAES